MWRNPPHKQNEEKMQTWQRVKREFQFFTLYFGSDGKANSSVCAVIRVEEYKL